MRIVRQCRSSCLEASAAEASGWDAVLVECAATDMRVSLIVELPGATRTRAPILQEKMRRAEGGETVALQLPGNLVAPADIGVGPDAPLLGRGQPGQGFGRVRPAQLTTTGVVGEGTLSNAGHKSPAPGAAMPPGMAKSAPAHRAPSRLLSSEAPA